MQRSNIHFTWDIHYKCNFRCPYCWFFKEWANIQKRNLYLPPQDWLKVWERIYDKYGEVLIEITGGEPFLYPEFIKLINLLSKVHRVKITSNLSGDIETFVKEVSPQRVTMDLNYHPSFADIDSVIKKTLLLKQSGFKAGICYLAYPPQMKQIDKVRMRFEEVNIGFALAAFWGEYNGKRYPYSYTEEEREYMRPYLGDIERIDYHLNGQSSKGKLCNAGFSYAVIQADGKVFRCGQLVDKAFGHILDESFSLLAEPLPCEAEFCPCNEYINLLDK